MGRYARGRRSEWKAAWRLAGTLLWASASTALAQQTAEAVQQVPEAVQQASEAVSQTVAMEEHPDVRVVIDVSGSMKHNDPNRLAISAVDLLVSLLPSGVSAGVWTFGEQIGNPLPLGRVEADWREQALALAPALQDYQRYTDIETALREAVEAEANGWRHLILLTDGVVDLPPARGAKPAIDARSRRRLMEELAPRLADQGVAVHAIAFSDQADLALVEGLAQRTGGLAALAESPDGLLGAFLDIIERIFPADQVPLENGRFVIDGGVVSLSALIFHSPDDPSLTLVAPDGTRYQAETAPEAVFWQVEPRFDLIRVPHPEAGEWRLEGPVGENSRISVSSSWHLRTTALPTTLYRGFEVPVEAWIEGDGLPGEPRPDELELAVELRGPDGVAQTSVVLEETPEGHYRGRLPAPTQTGNASLVIRADSQGFHRQRGQAVNVLPAIGMIHDPQAGRVVLAAEHPELDRDNTAIHGELQDGRLEAEAVDDRRWYLALPPLNAELRQSLQLTATVTLDGEPRELLLPPLILNPEGRIGLDRADLAGPTLATERFASPEALGSSTSAEPSLADRFVAGVNAVPVWLRDRWRALQSKLKPLDDRQGGAPLLWIGATFGLLLLLSLILWRRLRRPSITRSREEPHV